MEYSLGCKPSPRDDRNYQYATIMKTLTLPNKVDLIPQCTPIKDQDGIGACVAFACNGAKEFVDKKDDGRYDIVSERFLYYLIRDMMGTTDVDSGGFISYGMKCLNKAGVCLESEMKYDNAYYNFREMPTGRMLLSGLKRKISSYWLLSHSIGEMKTCLAEGYPFVAGVEVYDKFLSEEIAKTGDVPYPTWNETIKGGHAITIVGYNDYTERFMFRNSWGARWGNAGYGTIGYNYVMNYGWDFWTIRK